MVFAKKYLLTRQIRIIWILLFLINIATPAFASDNQQNEQEDLFEM